MRDQPANHSTASRLTVRYAFVLLLVAAATVLAACTGSTATKSSGQSSGIANTDRAAVGAPGIVAGIPKPAPGEPAKATTPLQERHIVRTAVMSVEVPNVDQAADVLLAKAVRAGGRVDGDDRNTNKLQRTAVIVLRTPPDTLDGLISAASGLGKETSRTVKGDDVSTAQADVRGRVNALTVSVTRLTDFLKHSGTINDLVSLESQLTEREAELRSTTAQQQALEDQVALATMTVNLSAPAPVAAARTQEGPSGFGSAFASGWHGLMLGVRWLLAGIGYGVPFALVAGMLGAAGVLILRRRRSGLSTTPAAATDAG